MAQAFFILYAESEDSDQTGRMPRLIWVFAGRTLILLVLSCCGSFFVKMKVRKLIYLRRWSDFPNFFVVSAHTYMYRIKLFSFLICRCTSKFCANANILSVGCLYRAIRLVLIGRELSGAEHKLFGLGYSANRTDSRTCLRWILFQKKVFILYW